MFCQARPITNLLSHQSLEIEGTWFDNLSNRSGEEFNELFELGERNLHINYLFQELVNV